jgi:hypothetical protein
MGIPIILACAGVLGIKWVNQNPNGENSTVRTAIVFQGIYMIVFAAVLFFYEIFSVCGVEMLDLFMKKNFGFLYGPIGKGLFTIMCVGSFMDIWICLLYLVLQDRHLLVWIRTAK